MVKRTDKTNLSLALDFIAPVMEKSGTLSDTHCSLANGYASAFNGLVGMGHPIDEDFIAYPSFAPLRASLARCKEGCSIAIKDSGDIFISAPPFRATIKGVKVNQVQSTLPDAPIALLDDKFRTHLPTLEKLIKDEDANAAKCSLLVQSGSMIATDAVMLIEAWHGQLLPTIMLPKAAVKILAAIKAPLTAFGFTPNRCATFWFDRAWFKTQLLDAKYPDLSVITSLPTNPGPMPAQLKEAIGVCAAHSDEVYFGDGVLQSHSTQEEGACYELPGLPQGQIFNGKYLALMVDIATAVDWNVDLRGERIAGFVGNGLRGFLMPRSR